jgi:Helix-turn-helix domain
MDQLDQTLVRTQPSVHSLRKTYKEKLRPTPAQERALEEVLGRCRALYNTALDGGWSRSARGRWNSAKEPLGCFPIEPAVCRAWRPDLTNHR